MHVKETVREKYAEAALRVKTGGTACCGSATRSLSCVDPITSNLYGADQTGQIPEEALLASLGCGNPTALAKLNPGEFVLDLGSGGGIDVLLSAKRVGPTGKAYGLDMTDEMLALARENQRKSGVNNVEFLKGEIENIPLPDSSVDVIISNCVINLSADKDKVLREAFVSSSQVGDLRFQMWLFAAMFPSRFGAVWNCGWDASRERFAITTMSPSLPRRALIRSTSSLPVSTASTTPGSFWPVKASTQMQ